MSDGNPPRLTWRQRLGLSRLAIVKAGKAAAQRTHQVAVQAVSKARLTGVKLARHIVAVQKAAGLDPRMMRESVQSVANRKMTRPADKAWQRAYVGEAARQVPGLTRGPDRTTGERLPEAAMASSPSRSAGRPEKSVRAGLAAPDKEAGT
jgi:hypothetical protein